MFRSLLLASALCIAIVAGDPASADTAVDWSRFHSHSKITGVVEKVDGDSITISVPKLEKNKTSNSKSRGGKNRRPSVKLGHEDIDIPYAVNGLACWANLPKKPDGKAHKSKELEDLMKPIVAPHYAAERSDIKPGHIVELHLVHSRDVLESKLTDKDIVIKYAVIEGETKAPPHAAYDGKKK